MKQIIFAAALLAGLASSGSAFADRWVAPVNGTVSAVTMPDGDVMMKITLPAEVYKMADRNMKANDRSCIVREISAGSPDTMILECGKDGTTLQ